MEDSYRSAGWIASLGTTPAFRRLLRLGLGIVLTMLVYTGLDYLVIEGTRLTEAAYRAPFIAPELISHGWTSPRIATVISGLLLLGGWCFRNIWRGWDSLEHGLLIRPFVTLTAAVLAWRFSTYDYNFYFDQAHLLDRLVLIGLVPLIWWRPVLVFPFLFLLCAVIWQFAIPLEFYSWAQQYMPIRLLILFGATLLLSSVTGRRFGSLYVFLACCLVMAHYWVPAVGKLVIDWTSQGHIYNLLPMTYANGWLSFLEPGQISVIAMAVARLDPLILFFTLLLQLGSVIALWRRRVLIGLLCLYPLFILRFSRSRVFFSGSG